MKKLRNKRGVVDFIIVGVFAVAALFGHFVIGPKEKTIDTCVDCVSHGPISESVLSSD